MIITKELFFSELERIEYRYIELLYRLLKIIENPEVYQAISEDLADLTIIEERRSEPTISHEQLLAELKQDGLI